MVLKHIQQGVTSYESQVIFELHMLDTWVYFWGFLVQPLKESFLL